MNPIRITFLGTGTSQGVPVIGCDCEVCQSENPKDKRLRTSIMISAREVNLVVDTGPDFRQQMLRAGAKNVYAILYTHEHNDHVIGLDDVRPFNFLQRRNMPLYATPEVQKALKKRFAYAFGENRYPGAPMLEFHTIKKEEPFEVEGIKIMPIEVLHGRQPVLGFRVNDFTYITDMKTIEQKEFDKMRGTKILVVNALHHNTHYSHLNLEEALEFIEKIKPEKSYLIHQSHRMGLHEAVSKKLPEGVALAYDGLILEI